MEREVKKESRGCERRQQQKLVQKHQEGRRERAKGDKGEKSKEGEGRRRCRRETWEVKAVETDKRESGAKTETTDESHRVSGDGSASN